MTQAQKILKVLQDADGKFVSGQHFLRTMYLSQYHARIFDLQRKGHNIVASDFVDDYGFKAYKLVPKAEQLSLI